MARRRIAAADEALKRRVEKSRKKQRVNRQQSAGENRPVGVNAKRALLHTASAPLGITGGGGKKIEL